MNQIVSKLKIVLTEVVDSTGKKHDHPGGGGAGEGGGVRRNLSKPEDFQH